MPKHALSRFNRTHKLGVAGVAAAGAAALIFAAVPGADADQGKTQATAVENVQPVAFSAVGTAAKAQQVTIAKQADASAAKGKAEAAAAAKKAAAEKAAKAKAAAAAKAKAKAKAEKERKAKQAASRSAVRTAIPAAAPKPAVKTYPNNLDGWIRESLDVMAKKGIPGSYNGIHRNIIRESSGNPMAINLWDINAQNGIPSKGLLQVIDPTFKAYHVAGTSWNIYDPVANITAACNYAAAKYGSMDNVNSAY
ncbi:transglycosylase SLT domain-containing protein [Streptomyces endophytica]|uniref:Transglycosylase SLT domain-containing protein n=1 Tax=Streptomyces endophytica TaxID=2991496 RepID=A0ABY6PEV8_9ACTN|nr:transglycosylase SLT domain-containing protein [Streptomyces endophytica]UZJ31985.1 transglycosylase SLT domain-containing protein [Streptomyces endophytica]